MAGKVGFFNMPPVEGGAGDQTAMMQDTNNGYGFSADVNTEVSLQIQKLIGGQTTPEQAAEGTQKVQDEAVAQ